MFMLKILRTFKTLNKVITKNAKAEIFQVRIKFNVKTTMSENWHLYLLHTR